jgi:hypothetical protein
MSTIVNLSITQQDIINLEEENLPQEYIAYSDEFGILNTCFDANDNIFVLVSNQLTGADAFSIHVFNTEHMFLRKLSYFNLEGHYMTLQNNKLFVEYRDRRKGENGEKKEFFIKEFDINNGETFP